MPSKWYEQMKEIGLHLHQSFRNPKAHIKYITLCSCGDLHSATNKETARYHTSAHQYGNSFYAEKHKMQTFKEFDIW